jgi:hypothetical protein
MTTTHRVGFSAAPFVFGLVLWASATALMLEEAWHANAWTVQSLLMPVLTSSAVAAGVLAHVKWAKNEFGMATLFLALALLGSALCVAGTLGRVAGQHDTQVAKASGSNATYSRKEKELADARAAHKLECKTRGPRCQSWETRIDALTKELDARVVVSADPRADALVRVAKLFGADEGYTRELIAALDAPSLPLYLELGALLFFASAFPVKKVLTKPLAQPTDTNDTVIVTSVSPTVSPLIPQRSWSQVEAFKDFVTVGGADAQCDLADRWGVSRGTVSRWLRDWHREGLIDRARHGREVASIPLALSQRAPQRLLLSKH